MDVKPLAFYSGTCSVRPVRYENPSIKGHLFSIIPLSIILSSKIYLF